MARSRWPAPPDSELMPSYGIDTLYFTIPVVHSNAEDILPYLQQYIDPALTAEHLIAKLGNGLYKQCVSISTIAEDPGEHLAPFIGKVVELLRVSFDPTPKSAGKLYANETTAFQVNGELLRRINYSPLLAWIVAAGGSVTRLDVYKDDFHHVLKMSEIYSLCSFSNYQTCVQSPLIRTYLDVSAGESSTYIGRKATRQINVYDKAKETGEKFHHIRVELKLRKDNKFQTALVAALVAGEDAEQLISSLISTYVTFKAPDPGRIHDRPPVSWWTDFLGAVSQIQRSRFIPVQPIAGKTYEQLHQNKAALLAKLAGLDVKIQKHADHPDFR